jgi:hypothetical protein
MSEEKKCTLTLQCVLSWLKVTDSWAIGGYQNKFPRLVYAILGALLLLVLI